MTAKTGDYQQWKRLGTLYKVTQCVLNDLQKQSESIMLKRKLKRFKTIRNNLMILNIYAERAMEHNGYTKAEIRRLLNSNHPKSIDIKLNDNSTFDLQGGDICQSKY